MRKQQPPTLAAALEELDEMQREIDRLTALDVAARKACDDLNVQIRFWRQCAEHAVAGWNALEDRHEAALEAVKRYVETPPYSSHEARAYAALQALVAEPPEAG